MLKINLSQFDITDSSNNEELFSLGDNQIAEITFWSHMLNKWVSLTKTRKEQPKDFPILSIGVKDIDSIKEFISLGFSLQEAIDRVI